MKLLMIYADRFAYRAAVKNLEQEGGGEPGAAEGAVVAFIHAEEADQEDPGGVETKLVKNLKWAARKNDSNRIVLHSFAHLAETKASPELTLALLDGAQARLDAAGYQTSQTPFGWFLDLELSAPGRSLARIFKSF